MEQAQKITDIVDAYKKKLTDKQYKDTLEAVGELLKVKNKFIRVKRIYMVTKLFWEDCNAEEGIYLSDSRSDDPWDSQLSFSHNSRNDDSEADLRILSMRSEMKYDETILQVLPKRDYDIKNSISEEDYDEMKQKAMIKRRDIVYIYIEDL